MASSSKPETLALALFNGLPTVPLSKAGEALRASKAVFGSSIGGGVARVDTCGGVEPAVGVLEAGDFLCVAGEPALRGSAECWRFSYGTAISVFLE